jgi:hypothetical protein
MRTLRTALTLAAFFLLCVGYGASQIAYFTGTFAEYASRVDQPPVQRLAGIMLLAAIVLCFIREKPQENS